jgi:hypothetical protein
VLEGITAAGLTTKDLEGLLAAIRGSWHWVSWSGKGPAASCGGWRPDWKCERRGPDSDVQKNGMEELFKKLPRTLIDYIAGETKA